MTFIMSCLIKVFLIVFPFILTSCGGGSPPKELLHGRVVIEKKHYQKTIFLQATGSNLIQELHKGNFDNSSEEEFLVVGSNGAYLFTLDGKVKFKTNYEQYNLYDVRATDIDNNGTYEFYSRALWGEPPVVVLDQKGNLIWQYKTGKEFPHLPFPVVIDIDGDNIKELIIPTANPYVFDTKGALKKKSSFTLILGEDPEVGDFDGDKVDDFLFYSQSNNEFIIQKVTGEVILETKPQLANFTRSTTMWRDSSLAHILLVGSEKMQIINSKGEIVSTLNTPYTSYSYRTPTGTPLLLDENNKSYGYVSLIGGRGGWHRTVLYINSSSGELLYQEVIEEDCSSILTLNDMKGKEESFLVGCRNLVWLYTPSEPN